MEDNTPQRKQLRRSATDQVIAGVCGGIGEYFEVDPTVIRIVFAVMFFASGSGLFLYILLWLLIPGPASTAQPGEQTMKEGLKEMETKVDEVTEKVNERIHTNQTAQSTPQPTTTATQTTQIQGRDPQFWLGVILILIGAWFFLDNYGFLKFFNFGELWPVFLIAVGLYYLLKRD